MKALIFAAGLGTRLKPYTLTMPKALVPVDGHPLLEHVLYRLKGAGVTDVVINVHHFADQIESYVSNCDMAMNIVLSDEREQLLETGGGIKHAEKLLNDGKPFLVHNVDILSNLDIKEFIAAHRGDSLATVLVSKRETERYLLFDDENCLVGWTNMKTGELKSPYENLDMSKCHKLAFAGLHVISSDVFKWMEGWNGKFSIIDFYLSICNRVAIRGYEFAGLEMVDVGKVGSVEQAEDFIKRYPRLYSDKAYKKDGN